MSRRRKNREDCAAVGARKRVRLQAKMARAIAAAVVISLVVSTGAVILSRHLAMRRSLETSARDFAALIRVPLVQIAEMYGSAGINHLVEARVQRLLALNRDIRRVEVARANSSVVFAASRDEVRFWSTEAGAPTIEDVGLADAAPGPIPIAERVRVDGHRAYRVIVPADTPPGPFSLTLVATFSYESVDRQLRRGLLVSVLALAAGLLVTDRVSKALARGITRGVADLHEGVRKIRSGRLDDRVDIRSNDEIEELAVAFNDMTDELQQTIGRLRAANRELQAIDQTKSDLLANVSHELRTPLTALKGFLELLDEGELGPLGNRAHRAVNVCRRNVDRLALRVEDLVQLSQLERPWSGVTTTGPVDMTAVVSLVAEMYGPRARAKGLELRVEMAPELPAVDGHAEQLERAVLNLIDNAIKFTPDGGRVLISAEECDHEGLEGLLLRVVDSGIGIPESEQVRVFDRFHQVDPSIRRRFGGMGLGLSLVHHTAEAHGGVVWLESEEGSGSTFFVWLPTVR